ncbi:MAG: hypothetical protein MUD10_05200 [Candidatus Pacebacteria bacterium]|jgi:hypothetical protein|nr:hypothetical protein [Candidatus Paceibacterota bacterium]
MERVRATLADDYANNRYAKIVNDFPDEDSWVGLNHEELEMMLWAYHHHGIKLSKAEKPDCAEIKRVRETLLAVADYQWSIAVPGKGQEKGYYKIKPFGLFYLGFKGEALALVEKGLQDYPTDLGIFNTKATLMKYVGDNIGSMLVSVDAYAIAVRERKPRLAGNFARLISDCLAAEQSIEAARAWLVVAINDWRKSQRKTKRTPTPLSAKTHIAGANRRMDELNEIIARRVQEHAVNMQIVKDFKFA